MNTKSLLKIVIGGILISPVFQYSYQFVSDWNIFYAAGTNSLTQQMAYHNPIWTRLFLQPFVIFGSKWGYCLLMGVTISSTLVISKNWSGKYLPGILAIVSVPFLRNMIHGQIEIFPLLGLFSSSVIVSPLLLWVKPQTALLSLAGKFRWDKRIVVTAIIISLFALITINTGGINDMNQNISIFPYGIPIGIYFGIKALVKGDILSGAIATPFIAPYLITHSIFVPLFAAYLRYPKLSVIIWAIIWAILLHFS